MIAFNIHLSGSEADLFSACVRSLLKELTLCLTSGRDMKRCQRECKVSFVFE